MEGYIIILFLLGLGYGVGHYQEKRHFLRLDEQEEELRTVGIASIGRMPAGEEVPPMLVGAECCGLVTGAVVIATDYFKVFAASLRNLFGGEVRSFETLVRRARREATVRMMTEAVDLGANAVINVRYETGTIGGNEKKKPGGVEVLVYGTAIRLPEHLTATPEAEPADA